MKLSNMEYGFRKIDELAQLMNVNKVNQNLKARGGPRQSTTNVVSTYFTGTLKFQVLRAENVQPSSNSGTSNPYLITQYPDSEKRASNENLPSITSNPIAYFLGNKNELLRTRVVYDSLNPSWDETFEILVNPSEKLMLLVYSKNLLASDDLIGVGIINFEAGTPIRNRLADHQTHNISLDLKPQGHIFLRITHEGEVEEIDFWFRKCRGSFRRSRQDLLRIIAAKVEFFY